MFLLCNLQQNQCFHLQKQPSRSALSKKCSENMQQIYRGTPMPKCISCEATLSQSHFGMGVLL